MSSAIADLVVAIVNHSNRDDTLACLAVARGRPRARRERPGRGARQRLRRRLGRRDPRGASRRRGDRAGGQARLRRQPERDHPGDLEPLRAGPQQRHARRARRPRHARALPRRASRRRRGRPARGRPRRRGATLGLDVSDGLECGRARGRGQPPGRPCPRGGRLRLRLRADAAPQRADADRRLRRGLLHVRGGEGSLPPHPRRPAPRSSSCRARPSSTSRRARARARPHGARPSSGAVSGSTCASTTRPRVRSRSRRRRRCSDSRWLPSSESPAPCRRACARARPSPDWRVSSRIRRGRRSGRRTARACASWPTSRTRAAPGRG